MIPGDLIGAGVGLGFMVSFFGFIVLLVWLDHRNKQRLREIDKEEHLALAERGLADHVTQLKQAEVEKERQRAVGAIGVAVGVSLACAAGMATMFVGMVGERVPLAWIAAVVLWPVVGAAILVNSILCLRALRANRSMELSRQTPRLEERGEAAIGDSPYIMKAKEIS